MSAVKNYERLSVEDHLFVELDAPRLPMTIALLAIIEDSGADFDEILATVESRLDMVPRFRRKLMRVPFGQGRPVWVDDENFDLRFHVRHSGLPRPGGRKELLEMASRVFSSPLDFSKPLWEMWIVDLPDNRKALMQKTHHCLVDGISAVDIVTVLFDRTAERPAMGPQTEWEPQPPPSRAELLRDSVAENITAPWQAARKLWGVARKPVEMVSKGVETARSVESFLSSSVPSSASTSLGQHVSAPHRRLDTVSTSLAEVKAIRSRSGATVNDVVLAVTAGGIRHLLRSRGEDTTGLVVKSVIPVSTRSEDEHYTYGNMIAAMEADLPVGEPDPWKRLELVQNCTTEAKETKQSSGVDFVARIGTFAPASLVAIAGRVASAQPMYSLVITNIPGPREPLYFVGGEMLEAFFFGPNLIQTTDLAVAVVSYNGKLTFGLTADRDNLPDVHVLAEGIEASLKELTRPG
ncbi:MAG: wax ester/triacylglycerol synthase family O-acyltransferase [Candidatus Nanopelagicales bacterium]|nr:wax ester/triacylglycerol synthase family O-acyltransferase [Candidatus Nanopelagicales bacterium]